MTVKILGVSGSPIKGGNADVFLQEALRAAEAVGGVETEFVSLAGMDIKDCVHVNWCLKNQTDTQYCHQEDDMRFLYPKVVEADGLFLCTPVYIGRMTGPMANFLNRLRVLVHGNKHSGKLKNKVGAGFAVVWFRNGGIETALLSLVQSFMIFEMIPVGAGMPSLFGSAGVTSQNGTGKFDPDDYHEVLKDAYGMRTAKHVAQRAVELCKVLQAGKAAVQPEAGARH
ncbi:MAG: flavodoxin family protein [Dehalococcoidia bacterium]|nr:flavodoxin family protein [Dehalococcoidia bacterium]